MKTLTTYKITETMNVCATRHGEREPKMREMIRAEIKIEKGVRWVYWYWKPNPGPGEHDCGYSGISEGLPEDFNRMLERFGMDDVERAA